MSDPAQKKPGRGGARPGAGRKPKGYVKPSALSGLNLSKVLLVAPPSEIDGVSQGHAHEALTALVDILKAGKSEAAKISAAKELLDRGYGKPTVEIGGDAAMLPFMLAPQPAVPTVHASIRAEARKYALLAVETLRKIALNGSSESAVASAAKALLDRGLGTVGKARMQDEQRDRPLGKKEELSRAAEIAASGPYATPTPPRRNYS